jgi:phosphoribosylaminoimidazole-succinocarboxamide synthase
VRYDEAPDAELIAAIPSSAAAFDAFYRRHIAAVMRFLARRCDTPEDVADAAADTFVAVLGSCSTYRSERGSVAAWLYGIARNAASDRLRERGRSDALALRLQGRRLLTSDDAERIAEMIDAERDAARLAPVLATARTSERELLDRIVDVDLTPAAASRSLGIEPSAGRRRLARLRHNVQVHPGFAAGAARLDHAPPIGGQVTTTPSAPNGPFEERLRLTMLEALYSGKVREVYDAGPEHLLLVASDRISAFDVVFDEAVPDKGRVLTAMTVFWAEALADVGKTHLVSVNPADYPDGAAQIPGLLGRSMLVRRAEMLPIECIVRGYIAGSAWREYREAQTVHGAPLPAGLLESARLPEPVFTPSTKATEGHDENISFEQSAELVGDDVAKRAREICLGAYSAAAELAFERGIVIADTKFELGFVDGELIICDEILTPDSSRFWPAESWGPGTTPPSFDKQAVRDWAESTGWDKASAPPPVPAEVIAQTRERYIRAYEQISGRRFGDWPGATAE